MAYVKKIPQALRLLLLALASLSCTRSTSAQNSEQVKEWAIKFVNELQESPLPQGVMIEYTIAYPATVTQAQIDKWSQEIQGRPDHPNRARFEEESRRLANGPDTSLSRLAWWSNRLARVSQDMPWMPDVSFSDTGVTGTQKWSLTKQGAILADDRTPSGKGVTFAYDSVILAEAKLLASIRSGGLISPYYKYDPTTIDVDQVESRWRVTMTDASNQFRVTASVRADSDRFIVEKASHVDLGNGSEKLIQEHEARNWRVWDHIDFAPTTCRILSDSGAVIVVTFQSVRSMTESDVASLAKPPERGAPDLIRGRLSIPQFNNLTGNNYTQSTVDKSGIETRSTLEFESGRSSLLHVGWIVAGTVILVVVTVWALRKR
jgi:hypothetical protein